MMTSFTDQSSWQDWVDFAHEKGPVDPDPTTCSVSNWCRSLGDLTIAEAIGEMGSSEDQIRTAIWIAMHAWGEFPASLRSALLAVIATDAPRAAYVYGERFADLTEAEKRILWDAFSSSMPVVRAALARDVGEPADG